MRIARGIFCSVLLTLSVGAGLQLRAGGGAWVKGPGGYYFKSGFTSITADREYDFNSDRRPLFRDTLRYTNGTIGISNLSIYGEYGFTSWLTGVISTQYSVAVREADDLQTGLTESSSASGLSDIWVSGRVKILPDGWPLAGAVTLGWKIPSGSPYKEIPLGTGVADYEGALAFGTGFPIGEERFGYAQISGGYRLRNSAANELNWQVEGGAEIIGGLGLQAIFDGTHSTADFDNLAELPDNSQVFMGLISDQSYSRLSGGLIYDLSEEMQLNFLYTGTLSGINSLAATSFSFGIAWKKQ